VQKPGGTSAGHGNHLIASDFAKSLFTFPPETPSDIDQVIGDDAESDTAFHPGFILVAGSVQAVPSL
jgi:hypothetical protein